MIPIEGMKAEPAGLPLMFPAWLGCLSWASGQSDLLRRFQQDTGLQVPASPIERMIDQATGNDRELLLRWCDWVTENVWGTDQAEPESGLT